MRVGGPSTIPPPITASPSQIYKERANTDDHFRILEIEGGKHRSDLCCSLVHARLSTAPKYEALSYCWGTEVTTRMIKQGGLAGCLVSEHLWRALKRLRMPSEKRLVWIDAICINQQDVDERNHQLGLMRHVYAKALRTIIWIGDFDPTKESCKRAFSGDGDTGLTLCVRPGLAETEHDNAVEDLRDDLERLKQQSRKKGKSGAYKSFISLPTIRRSTLGLMLSDGTISTACSRKPIIHSRPFSSWEIRHPRACVSCSHSQARSIPLIRGIVFSHCWAWLRPRVLHCLPIITTVRSESSRKL
jgi:hypothetical protein